MQKVFVGLSGGVDSSVSAALLQKAGYEVTGVFIRVWQPDFFNCGWRDDRLDAMRVCAKLNIPFVELNLEKEYKREVVDYMIREYKEGRTPNPDVFCNRFIKFGGFYEWAMKNGADFVATGHYARIEKRAPLFPLKKGRPFQLLASTDRNKDQSYFLWQIQKEKLPHILFPVGGMKKPEVRKLAKKFGLVTADKKDSQGLCFVGKVDMKEFLSHYIKPKKGNVLDASGQIIGQHTGAFFYTIGERLGLSPGLNLESGRRFNRGESRSLYVAAKDIAKNTLTVSHKSPSNGLPHAQNEVTIADCNWLAQPKAGKTYGARVRYRQSLQRARIMKYELGSMNGNRRNIRIHNSRFIIQFASPQTVAAGQSLVLYDRDVLLGGGVIA